MKNQELDDMLRRKLNVSSKVPDMLWDKIDHILSEQDTATTLKGLSFWNRNKKNILSAAAAVIALIATGIGFYFVNQDTLRDDLQQHGAIAQHQGNANNDINSGATTSSRLPDNSSTHLNNSDPAKATEADKAVITQSDARHSQTTQVKDNIDVPEVPTIALIRPELNWEKLPVNEVFPNEWAHPVALKKEVSEFVKNNVGLEDRHIEKEWMTDVPYPDYKIITRKNKPETENRNDILLGISGGYNYGSLNNGGAVALNTRKQINSKIFVDGSIGMVMNNSSNEQNNFRGDFMSFKKEFAQKISTNNVENLYSRTDPFYFIQVNPSVGINISKNLDVSVGPDYQQMVSNYSHDVINLADQSRVLPRYDFGVTGKAEVNLNKNIKAGLLVREGLTSIIKNNSNISDRRYIQIQLKYQLPYSSN